MKHTIAIVGIFGLSMSSGLALAQGAEAATEASAGAQASAGVSSTEVEQFAKAALAVQEIRDNAAISESDKPARMAAVVEQSGLAPTRFNEIAEASRSDEALMKQIQEAAAKIQQPATETTGQQ